MHGSSSVELICGVPQCSVLGPVLFIMYSCDLTTLIEQHSFCTHFYADDTQVYGSSRPSALQKTMCGGIYARVYCIFSACTMSSQRKFTLAISSPDEFLVCLALLKLCSIRRSFPTFVFQALVVAPTSVVGRPASAASWLHATEWTYYKSHQATRCGAGDWPRAHDVYTQRQ